MFNGIDYKKNKMSTAWESGRGNKRASRVTRVFFFFFCAPGIWDWQGTCTGTLYRRRFASRVTRVLAIKRRL
jgi:hypothetical protein